MRDMEESILGKSLEKSRRLREELKALSREERFARLQEIKYQRKKRLRYLKTLDLKSFKKGRTRQLTILHSNDLHGDFLASEAGSGMVGGVSMLSGYVNKVRNDEENVLYVIAGDMLRGSIIDSEYKGISTIEIMNLLAPEVATIGNHEIDYGLTHLLFIERCARFPIINANMYLKLHGTRLFRPFHVLEAGGIRILFIGVLTKDVLASAKQEELVGQLVDIHDAAEEVKKITDAYRTPNIDLTILLTHIGFEKDKELAAELDPGCGVDLIIGGHSHTYLEEPCEVAGIPIVQAAVGTAQIGRFDIVFDALDRCIDSYTWKLVPITEENCPRDVALEELIDKCSNDMEEKYGQILTRFARAYTHPRRNAETELGDLLAECMREQLGVDLAMIGSGSFRKDSLGPIVTRRDFREVFPYENTVIGIRLTGAQLKKMMRYILRDEAFDQNAHCEWFQFSKGFFCEYDRAKRRICRLMMNGREVQDEDVISTAIEDYHYMCMEENLGLSLEEVEKNGRPGELATDLSNVLEENLTNHETLKLDGEPRLIIR